MDLPVVLLAYTFVQSTFLLFGYMVSFAEIIVFIELYASSTLFGKFVCLFISEDVCVAWYPL